MLACATLPERTETAFLTSGESVLETRRLFVYAKKLAAVKNEEFQVDEDATVSNVVNGAYVQCWLWVDAETKPKRSKRTKA